MQMQSVTPARLVTTGLAFGESPRWHGGRLWVCNWGTSEIIATDAHGNREIMLIVPAVLPYSIDWLQDGRLLVVSGREGLLLRQEVDGKLVTHADLRGLSKSPWNEIVVDGRGNIYVNGGGPAPAAGEYFGPGTIVLIMPDGAVRQVADNIAFANGMAVTPDNKTLILAESHGNRLTAFDIAADGSLSNRRVWADLDGYPDGICLDAEGAIWVADPRGRRVLRVLEGGKITDSVDLAPRGAYACMLGGADRRTLFVITNTGSGPGTAERRDGRIETMRVDIPGAGLP